MKKVFIADFDQKKYRPRDLFPLVRPFLNNKKGKWEILQETIERWNCQGLELTVTSSIDNADFVIVSEPLNHNHDPDKYKILNDLNNDCVRKKIFSYAFIAGDYGKVHPQFCNIIYYRLGGFKSQLDKNNRALFPHLSDQLVNIFNQKTIIIREKKEKPVVGFCGHASVSIIKLLYEKFQLIEINLNRALVKDFYWEPLFSSAYERLKILKNISKSKDINTNFIFREKYRAGSSSNEEKTKTTKEYFNNMVESDYIICLRGGGNFSVRFFETLMMGRIPVLVDTDCILPLEDEIDWKKHIIWVAWKDRKKIASIISAFHKNISKENFIQMQKENRKIWLNSLSLKYFLEKISINEASKVFINS